MSIVLIQLKELPDFKIGHHDESAANPFFVENSQFLTWLTF